MEEEPTMSVIHADRPRSLVSDIEDFAAKPSGYDRRVSAFDAIPSWSRPSPFASLLGDENRPDRAAARRGPLQDEQFAEVVGPRVARLQRLARKILRSDDLADDAVQERC